MIGSGPGNPGAARTGVAAGSQGAKTGHIGRHQAPASPRGRGQAEVGDGLFRPAAPGRPTVLLLHGRAGDEHQLLPLLRAAGRDLGALAPRGPVHLPSGYAWCRRHTVGIPCTGSLLQTADALAAWLESALAGRGLTGPIPAVGYSNGGMVALALAAARPDLVRQVALVRGAYPMPAVLGARSLAGTTLLALGGELDGLLPPAAFWSAVRLYRARGARVIARLLPGAGHEIRPQDARELRRLVASCPAAVCRQVLEFDAANPIACT